MLAFSADIIIKHNKSLVGTDSWSVVNLHSHRCFWFGLICVVVGWFVLPDFLLFGVLMGHICRNFPANHLMIRQTKRIDQPPQCTPLKVRIFIYFNEKCFKIYTLHNFRFPSSFILRPSESFTNINFDYNKCGAEEWKLRWRSYLIWGWKNNNRYALCSRETRPQHHYNGGGKVEGGDNIQGTDLRIDACSQCSFYCGINL